MDCVGGTILLNDDGVFILGSGVNTDVKFEAGNGTATNFDIQLNSSNANGFDVFVEYNLSPAIVIVDGVALDNQFLKTQHADEVDLTIDDNVTLEKYEGSDVGTNTVVIGETVTTNSDFKTGKGDDHVTIGENETAPKFDTGKDNDTVIARDPKANITNAETILEPDEIVDGTSGVDTIDGGTVTDTYDAASSGSLVNDTLSVTADQAGDGTTDTVASVETNIADEVDGQIDAITLTGNIERNLSSGLSGGAPNAFGGVGAPTINALMSKTRKPRAGIVQPEGTYQIASGEEDGAQVGNTSFSTFEQPTFSVVCYAPRSLIVTPAGFALDQHQVVGASDFLSESLFLGPVAINGLTPCKRFEMPKNFDLIPQDMPAINSAPARPFLPVGKAVRQIKGHGKRRSLSQNLRASLAITIVAWKTKSARGIFSSCSGSSVLD